MILIKRCSLTRVKLTALHMYKHLVGLWTGTQWTGLVGLYCLSQQAARWIGLSNSRGQHCKCVKAAWSGCAGKLPAGQMCERLPETVLRFTAREATARWRVKRAPQAHFALLTFVYLSTEPLDSSRRWKNVRGSAFMQEEDETDQRHTCPSRSSQLFHFRGCRLSVPSH